MVTYLIKLYHGFSKGRVVFREFLDEISKTLEGEKMIFGLNYGQGQYSYSFSASPKTYATFESKFYTSFNEFQIVPDILVH